MTSQDMAVELFEIRIRGMLARMFSARQTDPSPEQWEMLRGNREITLRDIGEIAFHLDFSVDLSLQSLKAEVEE